MRSFVDRAAAIRVTEAVRVFRLVDPAFVISSGGEPHARRRGAPTGETMKDALLAAGVPAGPHRRRNAVENDARRSDRGRADARSARRIAGDSGHVRSSHEPARWGRFRAAGIRGVPAIAREFDPEPPLARCSPAEQGRSGRRRRERPRSHRDRLLLASRMVAAMIAHVVLMKPRPDLSDADRMSFVASFERAVRTIPSVRGVRVGRRVLHGAGYENDQPASRRLPGGDRFRRPRRLAGVSVAPGARGAGSALFDVARQRRWSTTSKPAGSR